MSSVQVLSDLCGDEDPEYLFIEYFQAMLQQSISQKLKEAQAITWESGTNYFDLVSGIINSAWIETNA